MGDSHLEAKLAGQITGIDLPACGGALLVAFLPLPPSVNRLYRVRRGGRGVYKAPAARLYGEYVLAASAGVARPIDGPLALEVWFFLPDRRSDIDNRVKALIDSLAGVLQFDDAQIVDLTLHKEVQPGKRGCLVILKALAGSRDPVALAGTRQLNRHAVVMRGFQADSLLGIIPDSECTRE